MEPGAGLGGLPEGMCHFKGKGMHPMYAGNYVLDGVKGKLSHARGPEQSGKVVLDIMNALKLGDEDQVGKFYFKDLIIEDGGKLELDCPNTCTLTATSIRLGVKGAPASAQITAETCLSVAVARYGAKVTTLEVGNWAEDTVRVQIYFMCTSQI